MADLFVLTLVVLCFVSVILLFYFLLTSSPFSRTFYMKRRTSGPQKCGIPAPGSKEK